MSKYVYNPQTGCVEMRRRFRRPVVVRQPRIAFFAPHDALPAAGYWAQEVPGLGRVVMADAEPIADERAAEVKKALYRALHDRPASLPSA